MKRTSLAVLFILLVLPCGVCASDLTPLQIPQSPDVFDPLTTYAIGDYVGQTVAADKWACGGNHGMPIVPTIYSPTGVGTNGSFGYCYRKESFTENQWSAAQMMNPFDSPSTAVGVRMNPDGSGYFLTNVFYDGENCPNGQYYFYYTTISNTGLQTGHFYRTPQLATTSEILMGETMLYRRNSDGNSTLIGYWFNCSTPTYNGKPLVFLDVNMDKTFWMLEAVGTDPVKIRASIIYIDGISACDELPTHAIGIMELGTVIDNSAQRITTGKPGMYGGSGGDAGAFIGFNAGDNEATDTTPDPFTFTSLANVSLNTILISNTITISGMNAVAPISIVGGTYAINGGAYTNIVGTVTNGDTVTVEMTSTGSYSTTTNAILTIGGISGTFSVTTLSSPTGNTPPTTTASAAGYAFGDWTVASPISIMLSAGDGAGSGVAAGYPKYCVDTTNTCTPATTYSAAINLVCVSGSICTQYVRYQSLDKAGNLEPVKSSLVMQDRQSPTDGTFTANAGNGQVSLNWSGFGDSGSGLHESDAYKVVCLTTGFPDLWCTNGSDITAITTQMSYMHAGPDVRNGTTYYYRVCAVDAVGNTSPGVTAFATPAAGPNRAPTTPTLYAPALSSETSTQNPVLQISASTDPEGDPITYRFEISATSSFDAITASVSGITARGDVAFWEVTPLLTDNILYYWRVLASDGSLNSPWMPTANLFVNTANDPPTQPAVSSPVNNVHVTSLTPLLSVTNATDVDMYDTLTYDFEIATDGGFTNIVRSINGVAQEAGGITSWAVTPALAEDYPYYWRGRARDSHGAASDWTNASFYVSATNSSPTAPKISSPEDTSAVATFRPTLTVKNATDSDQDPLHYVFEIDTVNTFDSASKQTSGLVAEGAGITIWIPSALTEDMTYYWRVKCNDGVADGPWMATARFFVNTENEPPSVPTLNNPANGGQVTVLVPTLTLNASTDSDNDAVTYEYQVFSSSDLTSLVTSTTGAGISWVVERNLEDNTWYWWRAQARDVRGLASGWMATASLFVNDKGYNDPPSIAITKPGATEPATSALSYLITWVAADPDSNPEISLYYDQTGSGYSGGTLIATGMHMSDPVSSYIWAIAGLTDGTYYVYARIDDGNTNVQAYAAGPLIISRAVSPSITAVAGMNGSIIPSGAVTVGAGSSQVFTITPNDGYRVKSVVVDGVDQGTIASYIFQNVTGNHNISASFAAITYTITANAGSNGTILPQGTLTASPGGNAVFTVTPNNGYRVQSVLVDRVDQGAIAIYYFTNINADHTISATFAPNVSYTITASVSEGSGSITPPGTTTLLGGHSQKYAITPASGYRIKSVTISGVSKGAITSYTFSNIASDQTIVASFEPDQYTITASITGGSGFITPFGATTIAGGISQTYIITPDTGYKINYVAVNGASVGAVTSYTFTNVRQNYTIKADFVRITFKITVIQGVNGTITPGTYGGFVPGSSQTYKIIPNAGYHVADVFVDGSSVGVMTSYTFDNIQGNHKITASFAPNP